MNLKILINPIKIGKIKIHIFSLVLLVAGFYLEFMHRLLIAYAITAIHETVHIITAKRLGVQIDGVEVLPFGITMRLGKKGIRNIKDEIKIAIAGPLSNLILAYCVYGLYKGELREYIIFSSLVIGAFNLLPALPLDGGRMLRGFLVSKFGCIKGYGIAMKITVVSGIVIGLAGLAVLYITGFNFSILLIGAFLIGNITEERKNVSMVIMQDILLSRKKLMENTQGGVLTVCERERASRILPRLSYDKYYTINIVDDNLRVISVLTETKFIELLSVLGTGAKMKKFVTI